MIIPKWGLVGVKQWNPEDYATDVLVASYEAYVSGGKLKSDTGVLYEEQGMLKVSFGRQKGHSTSIARFMRLHPEMHFLALGSNYNMTRILKNKYEAPHIRFGSIQSQSNPLLGTNADIVFLDTDAQTYMSFQHDIRQIFAPFRARGGRIILVMSDGVAHPSLVPTRIELDAPPKVLKRLGWPHDIASERRKTYIQ